MVIYDDPINFTYIEDGKPANLHELEILAIEEVFTGPHCLKNRGLRFSFTNQELRNKSMEVIEEERNYEQNDPRFLPEVKFVLETHVANGITTSEHGCITLNYWIEDLKGCVVAQKQIVTRDNGKNNIREQIFDLATIAAKSLYRQICNSKSNEQTCSKSHYTDELFCPYTVKLTRIEDIIQNNLNRGLKATEPELISLKEVSKRVIFIDPKNGKIKNVPLNSANYSLRTGYRQAYDYKNCKVYLEALDKKEDRDLNRAVVRVASTTPNRRFGANTHLIFDIMDVEPMIDIDWHRLSHGTPYFSKKGTYVKTNMVSKRLFGNEEWYEKMRYVVKKAGEHHLDSRCNIQDAKEFTRGYWMDSEGYKLSYDYDMKIRPATKFEIEEARMFLKHMKHNLKDRQLYKTINSTKGIYEWIKSEKNKKNQKKLKKKMGKEIDLLTD